MDKQGAISHKGCDYVVTYDDEKKSLVVTNVNGEIIETREGQSIIIRKDVNGYQVKIDLATDKHRAFYNELLKKAWSCHSTFNENSFFKEATISFDEDTKHLSQTLNIAVVGKVSSGKSSLINALLMRGRRDAVAKVGVEAGVTTNLKIIKLDENVRLIDSPGLDDIKKENSDVTKAFLANIDVGILVVTGVPNESQKSVFDDLKQSCSAVFLALNKIDEYDVYSDEALSKVIEQWRTTLAINTVYPVCTFGYDPDLAPDTKLNLRGIEQLRNEIELFLDSKQKKLLLARHMSDKRKYAQGAIVSAIALVGVQAVLPGRAAFITATQLTAIAYLHFLYKGIHLSKASAFAVLPIFAGQAVATNVFLFFTSFIPPTGIIEVAAAVTAISITSSMLLAVNHVLSIGLDLKNGDVLKKKFNEYKNLLTQLVKIKSISDLKNLNLEAIVNSLM